MPTLNGGGAEKVTLTLMKLLDVQRFDIYLVMVEKKGEFLKLVPSYVTIVELKRKKTLFSIGSLRKVIKTLSPNIIYSTLFRTHIALELSLLGLKQKPKRVYRSPTSPKTLMQREEIGHLMRYFIGVAYRRADVILAQTPEMKEEISSYHRVKSEKIIHFLNPLDTKIIEESIANKENPFNPSDINIVAAGRLCEVKGFDVLLKAFQDVYKKNQRFYLHIIGRDGGEQKRLEAISKEFSIAHRVKFWGFQANPYLFFHFSDLYVLSSRREGLPNTVLENRYLKKPIVATACIPFMDRLITDGENGFIVEVNNPKAMADAILNYKRLNMKHTQFSENQTLKVNKLFEKVVL